MKCCSQPNAPCCSWRCARVLLGLTKNPSYPFLRKMSIASSCHAGAPRMGPAKNMSGFFMVGIYFFGVIIVSIVLWCWYTS